MRPFHYERATSPQDALRRLAADPDARYLAGGTNLVDLMRLGVEAPPRLIDVTAVTGSSIQDAADGGLVIGAAVRNSELAADPRVRVRYPALSQALLDGASGQLRNLATTAGNLLQRTRCLYFQDISKACNKREPGSGCPAVEGEHRNLAIFGHSEACVATHPSDMAVALAALDATVHVQGMAGERVIPVTELHRLPGSEPQRDTELAPGDLITAVSLAPLGPGLRSRYRKVRERRSFAFALVSIAAALGMRDGLIDDVRIALGGVAHRPWRARRAEQSLLGGPLDAAALERAADAELEQARPLRDNGFKVDLVRNLIVGELLELGAGA